MSQESQFWFFTTTIKQRLFIKDNQLICNIDWKTKLLHDGKFSETILPSLNSFASSVSPSKRANQLRILCTASWLQQATSEVQRRWHINNTYIHVRATVEWLLRSEFMNSSLEHNKTSLPSSLASLSLQGIEL
jgi:hypothetical protein